MTEGWMLALMIAVLLGSIAIGVLFGDVDGVPMSPGAEVSDAG